MLERMKPAVEGATVRASIAMHGLHAARLHRKVERAEGNMEGLEHEAAFYEALGGIATQITGTATPGAPNKYTGGESETTVAGQTVSANLPPKVFTETHAFGGQASYHRSAPTYRATGRINKAPKTPTLFTSADMVDPRDPTGATIITPRTRKERKRQRLVAKGIHEIRNERSAQDTRRGMLGDTGPNHYWRTKFRHWAERGEDRRDVRNGTITEFEAHTNAQMRRPRGDMDQGDWRLLRRGEESIRIKSDELQSKTVGAADTANQKLNKAIEKRDKLAAKRREAVIKKNLAKARR